MKKKQLTIFDAGIAFVLSFILAQFTSAIGSTLTEWIMKACGRSSAQIGVFFDSAVGYLLQALFMNIAFVLVFVWYFRQMDKNQVFNKPTNDTTNYIIKCVIIGVATLFLLSGTLNYFQLLVDKLGFSTASLPYEINSPAKYIISLISLAVIPAVCEELIFRGVIVNCLRHKGHTFAIVLSSIMFSMFHFSPSQLIYPICFGLILSIVYLRTNNIIFPMLLHFINNALSLSIQYFSGSSGGTFTHSASMLMYALITLAIWIAIIIHLFKDFKSYKTNKTTENITQDISTEAQNPETSNDKLNNTVFYGSLALMGLIYIMLIFV